MPRWALDLIRQNADWVAVHKPAGLAVIPGRGEQDSVLEALGRQLGLPATGAVDPRVRVCHRLDKDTTGVLVFALHKAAQRLINLQFQANTIEKEYVALVTGRLMTDEGEVAERLGRHPSNPLKMAVVKHGGRPSVTRFKVMQRYRDFTLVRCFPKTGKTHQIRVHLAHQGHPLAIDPLYNARVNVDGLMLSRFKRGYQPAAGREERPLIARLPLHAERLKFIDAQGEQVDLHAPLPKDFRAAVNMLEKYGR